MANLEWYQYLLIGLVFVWSGFVRSGLGFGGAVLALPFLLLIVDEPLIFLPLIAVHLLIFSSWIMWQSHRRQTRFAGMSSNEKTINWGFLGKALKVMIIPKMLGVVGLLTLSPKLMSSIIFAIVLAYAVGYIANRPIRNQSKVVDNALLAAGGYFSGTSLTGAPLVIPVFAAHVPKHQLRDTLFVLWFVLTSIKLTSFVVVGVDLHLIHHLWLFPCAWLGHILGNRLHTRIVAAETPQFFRALGIALIVVSGVGLWRVLAG